MENLDKILAELENIKKRNEKYCMLNDCAPSDYMIGVNDNIDHLTLFVQKLKDQC